MHLGRSLAATAILLTVSSLTCYGLRLKRVKQNVIDEVKQAYRRFGTRQDVFHSPTSPYFQLRDLAIKHGPVSSYKIDKIGISLSLDTWTVELRTIRNGKHFRESVLGYSTKRILNARAVSSTARGQSEPPDGRPDADGL